MENGESLSSLLKKKKNHEFTMYRWWHNSEKWETALPLGGWGREVFGWVIGKDIWSEKPKEKKEDKRIKLNAVK